MKIAITSKGRDLDSEIDPRFGRAAYIIVVDTDSLEFEALDNSENVNAFKGAGIQAAQTVSDHGAEVLLTGHCGPKAFTALSAAGIRVFTGLQGSVGEALKSFQENRISEAKGADRDGHWS